MAKTATATVSKAASKRANAKTTKSAKSDKPKRAPSAYNLFVQAHMKPWLEANKDKNVKDAMVEIGALWRDAPENPNRGKATTRKSKAASKPKETKAKAKENVKPDEDEEASSEVDQELDEDER